MPRTDELGRPHLAAAAERVQVADIRLVLEDEQRRDLLQVEPRPVGGDRRGPAALEARELQQLPVDHAPAPVGERVDERAADAECLPFELVERAVELLVADEHVPVHLVAGAAADRVVRLVPEQVPPREPEVCAGERLVLAQRPQGRHGLDREESPLGSLVRLLEVDPRGVDAAQDVLQPAAHELALVHRQGVQRRGVLVVAADPELRAERGCEPVEQLRQLRLDREVVGAVREQDRVLPRVLQELAEALDDPLHALLCVVVPAEPGEVVVMRQQLAGDDLGRAGAPAEDDADVVELVAEPAREEEGADAEAREDLRQLRGMAEAVGEVAGAARLDPEAAADAPAEEEIADERLAAHEDLVGKDVRGAGLQPAGLEQSAQPPLVLRPDVDVVLEHDRLAVEGERRERRVPLERLEDIVDRRAEPQPEDLERQVPLAVPVRVRDDEEAEVGGRCHRRGTY